jgi:hypothetical protein
MVHTATLERPVDIRCHASLPPASHLLRRVPLVLTAIAPLNPQGIVHDGTRVQYTGDLEGHREVVVTAGELEDLVVAVAVHRYASAARPGRPVHGNRRAAHNTSVLRHCSQTQLSSSPGICQVVPCVSSCAVANEFVSFSGSMWRVTWVP